MKNRKVLFYFLVVLVFGVVGYAIYKEEAKPEWVYKFPEGFRGCAVTVYNVKDALPLKIENKKIVHSFNEKGVLYTSSPYDFGWQSEERSGFHETTYIYVDHAGKEVGEISADKIAGSNLGSYFNERVDAASFLVDAEGQDEACLNKVDTITENAANKIKN